MTPGGFRPKPTGFDRLLFTCYSKGATFKAAPYFLIMIETIDYGPRAPVKISDAEFGEFRSLVYDKLGINLSDQKRSLVAGRLSKIFSTGRFNAFSEYLHFLRNGAADGAISELADIMTTNLTFFMREKAHFDFLFSRALPEIAASFARNQERDIRIWCAGCSTGEEAYTLAMLLTEHLGAEYPQWNTGVLATDISENVLSVAREGIYGEDRIAPLPPLWKQKYFSSAGKGFYAVRDSLKKDVTFRRFNLINERFPFKKPFHAIFCRNVMIYFDQTTRDTLVRKFFEFTEPGGYLFIGHSETIRNVDHGYRYIMPAVYKKA